MSSSDLDVVYHVDNVNRRIIATIDDRVVGTLPWTIEDNVVTMGLILVAPHVRRQGIGYSMIVRCRDLFPREAGYELRTTPALTPIGEASVFAPGKDDRRTAVVDYAGTGTATALRTVDVTARLAEIQQDFDSNPPS